ncbi:MAG: STAS domain-containing protein [Kiritimatiellae bacterium]|nr:STAS domain-containing protein [Kiritimatiellia bacterium]
MNIDKKLDNGCLTLKVEGRLDTNTSPELEAELNFDGVTETVFDFSGLEYISSAGLRVLMAAHKAMAACGGKMSVASPNAIVKGVFDITGMNNVFNIVEG